MSAFAMKNLNGSECTNNERGLITRFRDASAREWFFEYAGSSMSRVIDPLKNVWVKQGNRWAAERVTPGTPTPKSVTINNATGAICVEDSVRTTTYLADGTTQIDVVQLMNGKMVPVRFVEYSTKPYKAFVVTEKHAKVEQVTWIQDAHLKLFKVDYDANGKLARYTDHSAKPAIEWTAQYDAHGNIESWSGMQKETGKLMGTMHPNLQAIELNGNRHFRSVNGSKIVVTPSGAAFAPKSATQGESQSMFVNPFQTAHLNF